MAAEDQWRTADGVREPSPELLPERRRPSAEGGPRRSACTQERLSPRPRGAFLTARLAQPLTRLNYTCGRLCGRRTCAWEGPAFGGNVAVASGGARDACSSRERCGSRISVVPQFWLQDDPPPFLPRLSSPCAGASEAPPSRSGPPSLKTGCDA